MESNPKNIIISRTDSIGDVVLTLPMAKVLKDNFHDLKITFLAKEYTKPVIDACQYIDSFVDVSTFISTKYPDEKKYDTIIHVFPVKEIAQKAKQLKIKQRIGTSHRFYHRTTCNHLISFSRKNSNLHEVQLNLKLLNPFEIKTDYSLNEIQNWSELNNIQPLEKKYGEYIIKEKYNLIIHPKSHGNTREWDIKNFINLINSLDGQKFNILVSGTKEDRASLKDLFEHTSNKVKDITGLMELQQFISFINECDGLLANSTGPLHIAAALSKDALGIYPPIKPMHPGRWAPIGKKAKVFVIDKKCNECRDNPSVCHCINEITSDEVKEYLNNLSLQRGRQANLSNSSNFSILLS